MAPSRGNAEVTMQGISTFGAQRVQSPRFEMTEKTLVLVLPPFQATEQVDTEDVRMDSEGYTSRIFNCCT